MTGQPVLAPILGRFVVGLGIGADLPVSTTLIAESVGPKRRGSVTGLMQVFWFAGASASGIAGILLYLALGESSWRWMLGSAAVLAVVRMLLRRGSQESAAWQDARRAEPTATSTRTAVAGSNPLLANRTVRIALIFSCLFWFLVTIRGAGFNL
ncbi:MFS transporter [Pseudonocardia nigra]|uniref:MFS transporter n=1 Tax=Pseudonocardia nigra TaxID=1921578 RepID=UPI001C5E0F3A|nr:MFS transporter [Pseudonocardia nigra]